ncbi:GMC oxidoreductase [Auriscalpium vulgare]|uniref:GMC oxidoreductase n=1 Tax=Auriscalpium vulgare TaxID=40419 RepID=A0ACB8RIG2_9AGAM|nr:GMC oxidoreductase [Auriscalpium vulgare]
MRFFTLSFSVFSAVQASLAALYTDVAALPKSTYDFIVVGAGTAGSVIANRLSANPRFSILVVEAGGSDANIEAMQIPFLAGTILSNASLIWNYTTTPQRGLGNRIIPYQRGRVLGGSSSVNSLVFTRGSRDDFDRFARVTGDAGWSWDSLFPLMLKAEGFVDPVDNHDITGQYNASAHGRNGPVRTTLPGFPSALDPRVLATTQADPARFPFNLDTNDGDTIGLSWTQSTGGNGVRSSAATAYLWPALRNANLDVLIDTRVTRLVNSASRQGVPEFRSVELAQNASGTRTIVSASKEVILSAGAINTPQLLLLSGIGDQHTLSTLGIKTLVNSTGVGSNLQDHPLLANQWSVNSTSTLDDISRNATLAESLLVQWEQTKTGQFVDVGGNQFAWLRLPANSTALGGHADPSAGKTSAHMELFIGNTFASFIDPAPATGNFISVITGVSSPISRGSITLASNHPFDFPIIDPGFLTHPADVAVMVEALHTATAMISTAPWLSFILGPYGALANATTDIALAAYARDGVTSYWHPCCTAKMGTSNDETAVVDSKLLVKGAAGLRIVDASVFPYIPAAHLQAPVYAIAERAAQLIEHAWSSG